MARERPRSDIFALFDWQHIIAADKSERDGGSDTKSTQEHKHRTSFICGSYKFMRESDSAMREEEVDEDTAPVHRTEVTLTLKPRLPSQTCPKIRFPNEKNLARRAASAIDIRRPEKHSGQKAAHKTERESSHRRHSIDVSLAKLRHEMNSLRRQDVELLEQLLSLDNSIREFRLSQASLSDSSDISDDSDAPEVKGSLDTRTRRWQSRGSLGSDGSDHLTPLSGRSCSGSNPSLSGSDVGSSESGHRQMPVMTAAHRRSKGSLGDLRKFPHRKFGSKQEHTNSFSRDRSESWLNGSDVSENGSGFVLPIQPVRRNSAFRLAETKSVATLSKRQSTIW